MDARIKTMVAEMEYRLAEPLTLADLATRVNLSPSRFAHLFRLATGLPPMQYLQRLRMTRARLLLERTSLPVRDVMTTVGYRDASHFARDFRKFHGTGPAACRREVRHRTAYR